MTPANPVAAASHDHPYPWYRQLRDGPPLRFDASLNLWVASRADVIEEVFDHPDCMVRPTAEPVPKAIAGSSAGDVFSRLVRMNDGAAHAGPKAVLRQALAGLDLDDAARRAGQHGVQLAERHGLPGGAALTAWIADLPTYVVADLLGFECAELPRLAQAMAAFVRCLSPLCTPDQSAAASDAAHGLLERFELMLRDDAPAAGALAWRIGQDAKLAGWDRHDAILANLLGLLSQTNEATAGLLGNAITAWARDPALRARLAHQPQLLGAFVRETARRDASVQNTRRFVARPTSVAGVALAPGDTILLLLGAAGRDQRVHLQPDELVLDRPEGPLPGFGHGRHACPGQQLALAISTAALGTLLARPDALAPNTLAWTWRRSANGRIPVFSDIIQSRQEVSA